MSASSPWLIVVTGRPAAGKTTLATWLSKQLRFPLISKDEIKEILFEQLGWRDREWSRTLGRASIALMYYFAGLQLGQERSLILENAFHPDLASPELQSLRRKYRPNVLQIICDVDNATLLKRFKQRATTGARHQGHVDLQAMDELQWSLAEDRPLQLEIDGHLLRIDTSDFATVRYEQLLEQVKRLMAKSL